MKNTTKVSVKSKNSKIQAVLTKLFDNLEKPIQKHKPQSKPVLPPAPMPTVELQGFVARGNGDNTIWINDVAVQTGQFVERQLRPISMDRSTGKVRIKMPNSSVIILQPGQKFEPEPEN